MKSDDQQVIREISFQLLKETFEGPASEHLREVDNWGENEISVATSVIAHTAYHLGAIRQLIVAQALSSQRKGFSPTS